MIPAEMPTFDPVVAGDRTKTCCSGRPDLTQPRCWHTAVSGLAVETIWWGDGSWGHSGPAIDDTGCLRRPAAPVPVLVAGTCIGGKYPQYQPSRSGREGLWPRNDM